MIKYLHRTKSIYMLIGYLIFQLHSPAVSAQVLSSFDSGTGTTGYLPINANYEYSYAEMIYFKTEMNPQAQNVNSTITKVKFFIKTGNLNQSTSWKIFMGHTSDVAYANNSSYKTSNNLTEVFNGSVSGFFVNANQWMEITLQTPFVYNGLDNLVLAVEENSPNYSFNPAYFSLHNVTSSNRSIYTYNDYSPISAASPSSGSRTNAVPYTIFEHQPAAPCSGAPVAANVLASPSIICAGGSTTLTHSTANLEGGIQYIWQQYINNTWVSIDTTLASSTVVNNIVANTNYRVRLLCTNSNLSDDSQDVTVSVQQAPTVTTNLSSIYICDGETIGLIASGAANYTWSPTNGLTSTNTNITTANISQNTTYQVIGSNAAGCSDTATIDVKILSKAKIPFTVSGAQFCTPGSPITITAPNNYNLSNSGVLEFSFVDQNGNVLQAWSANNTYTFTPTSDSLYKITGRYRSSVCITTSLDSTTLQIPVGFGTDYDLVQYNCTNLGGSISLTNSYGQQDSSLIYQNNLQLAHSSINLHGNASYNGNELVLTPSSTSQQGYAIIEPMQILSNDIFIEFDMTANNPINNYGTGGADGIAYSFGNDINTTIGYNSSIHNGLGSKIRISFDAAANSSNDAGIYLVYGKNNLVAPIPTENTTIAFNANTSLWKNQADVPVKVSIQNGRLTLTVNHVVIFNNVALPTSFLQEDLSTWKHSFSAQTGGDAMYFSAKNLVVTGNTMKYALTTSTTPPTTWSNNTVFTNLQPGVYHIWMAKSATGCNKLVRSLTVSNTNPLVNLGNDTILCSGSTLVLDAGNAGSTYVWSGTQAVGQQFTVTQGGVYSVVVTDTNQCTGIGNINVIMQSAPSVLSLDAQKYYQTAHFTLLNAQNYNSVNWDFGDGVTLNAGPANVSHIYDAVGTYTVTATLENSCGTTTISTSITIDNILDIDQLAMELGLMIFPNPAQDVLNVQVNSLNQSSFYLTDITGRVISEEVFFQEHTTISMTDHTPGIYMIHIKTNENEVSQRFIIE